MNKALLVGINQYDLQPLKGCVNDIQDMSEFLIKKCGFQHKEIRKLTDFRATKAAILKRLKWLIKGTSAGDRIYFHYSGHGTQIASRSEDDEIDGMDELICPVDFSFSGESGIENGILDNELYKIFKEIPKGVHFIWVSDCCCSGTLTRAIRRNNNRQSRYLVPPEDLAWRNETAMITGKKITKIGKSVNKLNVAFLSACKDHQEADDDLFENGYNGALTYFLLNILKTPKGHTQNFNQIHKSVQKKLVKAGYSQSPMVDGSKDLLEKTFFNQNQK